MDRPHIDPQDMAHRLRVYFDAYYDQLREEIEKYSAMADAFPSFLVGPKHVFAVLLGDGLIVIEYPSDRYFGEVDDQSEIDVRLYLFMAGSQLGAYVNLPEEFDLDNNYEMEVPNGDVPDEHGGTVRLFSFDRITITHRVDEGRWSQDLGREKARKDVATFVVARLLHIKEQRHERVLEALQATIEGFEQLLTTDPQEEIIQRYLTNSPVLLEPTAARITPKVKLGTEYVTDFVIERTGRQYILVEIEIATKKGQVHNVL